MHMRAHGAAKHFLPQLRMLHGEGGHADFPEIVILARQQPRLMEELGRNQSPGMISRHDEQGIRIFFPHPQDKLNLGMVCVPDAPQLAGSLALGQLQQFRHLPQDIFRPVAQFLHGHIVRAVIGGPSPPQALHPTQASADG